MIAAVFASCARLLDFENISDRVPFVQRIFVAKLGGKSRDTKIISLQQMLTLPSSVSPTLFQTEMHILSICSTSVTFVPRDSPLKLQYWCEGRSPVSLTSGKREFVTSFCSLEDSVRPAMITRVVAA